MNVLTKVFGFTGQDGTGAPHEITPQTGDTFTILDKWMDLDAQGNVVQEATQAGETLTFGVLVAFIQAYIFTLLSAVFIGMYAHPAH